MAPQSDVTRGWRRRGAGSARRGAHSTSGKSLLLSVSAERPGRGRTHRRLHLQNVERDSIAGDRVSPVKPRGPPIRRTGEDGRWQKLPRKISHIWGGKKKTTSARKNQMSIRRGPGRFLCGAGQALISERAEGTVRGGGSGVTHLPPRSARRCGGGRGSAVGAAGIDG